jgi:hypothetical protein
MNCYSLFCKSYLYKDDGKLNVHIILAGVNVGGDQFSAESNKPAAKLSPENLTGDQFFTGINHTGDQFVTGINHTATNLSQGSTTPATNLSPGVSHSGEQFLTGIEPHRSQ